MPIKKNIPPEKRKKYQRADGRFARRITLPDGSKPDVYGNTFKDMQENINKLLEDAKQGIEIGDKSTLNEWADKWFATYKASVRYNTMQILLVG